MRSNQSGGCSGPSEVANTPLGQPRLHSLYESFVNIGVGLITSVLGQLIIFPMVGIQASLTQNLGVAVLFTILSVIRHYSIRRLFNWLHIKQNA